LRGKSLSNNDLAAELISRSDRNTWSPGESNLFFEGIFSLVYYYVNDVIIDHEIEDVSQNNAKQNVYVGEGVDRVTPQEIKRLRKEVLKISTTELAQLCGVKSRRTVEQWETEIGKRGHRSPGGSSLKILLDLQAEHTSRKRYDQYNVVKRIIWIRDQLLNGQMFNSTDVAFKFDTSLRTAHRDMHYMRDEMFKGRLKFNAGDNSYYLEPE